MARTLIDAYQVESLGSAGVFTAGSGGVAQWSAGAMASGGIVAFNGSYFYATTVADASLAAGQPIVLAGSASTIASGVVLTVEGEINALPSGHVHVPYPTQSIDAASKQYVDDQIAPSEIFNTALSNLSLTDVDTTVFVDSTAGPVDVILPIAHTAGRRYIVKDFGLFGLGDTEANLVRIVPTGGALLEGYSGAMSLQHNQESATIIGNGIHWGRV